MEFVATFLSNILKEGTIYKTILTSILSLIVGALITLIVSSLAKKSFLRLATKTKSTTDDFIVNVILGSIKPLGLILTISFSWVLLPINDEIDYFFLGITKLLVLFVVVRLVNRISLRLLKTWSHKVNDDAIGAMIESIAPMVRASVWLIGTIFYLQNMGVQMAAVWALLSAGGIGAGLALKEPVQEFFEYITILLDKPFQKGQFIHVDNVWASVERVGVRSTRLRSLSGETIVMSNSKLTSSTISNYAEMKRRRLVHKIGLVYGTTHELVSQIPIIVESIINRVPDADYDRCSFIGFGDFSLDFEIVYFVPTGNYKRAMTAQQNINIEIMKEFKSRSIEFAFPTNTIHINKQLE
ncbi:mechanosensitive ion channel family protein [Prochlorococcus sp. MIT 1341]|uniref:mechanosensitive ion channel family protein n=1 Tax=Prochlorococcus sp. MIT 1341 TaxID=3096221 RepID=UPI002A754DA5|nr:mechanosensitive ion channel domain-containing protein [Prochlorococcus sp. MIT 1341]